MVVDESGGQDEDIANMIRTHVWSGEYSPEEVGIIIEDNFDTDPNEKWLRAAIEREFAAKRTAEQTWPEETECDRLERSFEMLETRGIIVECNADDNDEGAAAVNDLYKQAGAEKSKFIGYCFYTEQEKERAVERPGMYLAFGAFGGNDSQAVAVGEILREEFERVGFDVEWDGNPKNWLIFLSKFCWQKRNRVDTIN